MPFVKWIIEPVFLSRQPIPPDKGVTDDLEAIANATLVNILKQLTSLAAVADTVFQDVFDECKKLQQNTERLRIRVDKCQEIVDNLNAKKVSIPLGNLTQFSLIKEHYRSEYRCDTNFFTPEARPEGIRALYEKAASRSQAFRICEPVWGDVDNRTKRREMLDIETRRPSALTPIRTPRFLRTSPPELVSLIDPARNLNSSFLNSENSDGNPTTSGDAEGTTVDGPRGSMTSPLPHDMILPTPFEKTVAMTKEFPAVVLPIDTSEHPYERMSAIRRSLIHVDFLIKRRKSGKKKRRHTEGETLDDHQQLQSPNGTLTTQALIHTSCQTDDPPSRQELRAARRRSDRKSNSSGNISSESSSQDIPIDTAKRASFYERFSRFMSSKRHSSGAVAVKEAAAAARASSSSSPNVTSSGSGELTKPEATVSQARGSGSIVKLRETSARPGEDVQSSSGNWSAGSSSTRASMDSDNQRETPPAVCLNPLKKSLSESSLEKDSALSDTTHSTEAPRKIIKSSSIKQNSRPSMPKRKYPNVSARKPSVCSDDGESSTFSVDTDGYITSMHTDSGLFRHSMRCEEMDEEEGRGGGSTTSLDTIGNVSLNSILSASFEPGKEDAVSNCSVATQRRAQPPQPPERTSSVQKGLSVTDTETDTEHREQFKSKTEINKSRYPSICAVSSPDHSGEESDKGVHSEVETPQSPLRSVYGVVQTVSRLELPFSNTPTQTQLFSPVSVASFESFKTDEDVELKIVEPGDDVKYTRQPLRDSNNNSNQNQPPKQIYAPTYTRMAHMNRPATLLARLRAGNGVVPTIKTPPREDNKEQQPEESNTKVLPPIQAYLSSEVRLRNNRDRLTQGILSRNSEILSHDSSPENTVERTNQESPDSSPNMYVPPPPPLTYDRRILDEASQRYSSITGMVYNDKHTSDSQVGSLDRRAAQRPDAYDVALKTHNTMPRSFKPLSASPGPTGSHGQFFPVSAETTYGRIADSSNTVFQPVACHPSYELTSNPPVPAVRRSPNRYGIVETRDKPICTYVPGNTVHQAQIRRPTSLCADQQHRQAYDSMIDYSGAPMSPSFYSPVNESGLPSANNFIPPRPTPIMDGSKTYSVVSPAWSPVHQPRVTRPSSTPPVRSTRQLLQEFGEASYERPGSTPPTTDARFNFRPLECTESSSISPAYSPQRHPHFGTSHHNSHQQQYNHYHHQHPAPSNSTAPVRQGYDSCPDGAAHDTSFAHSSTSSLHESDYSPSRRTAPHVPFVTPVSAETERALVASRRKLLLREESPLSSRSCSPSSVMSDVTAGMARDRRSWTPIADHYQRHSGASDPTRRASLATDRLGPVKPTTLHEFKRLLSQTRVPTTLSNSTRRSAAELLGVGTTSRNTGSTSLPTSPVEENAPVQASLGTLPVGWMGTVPQKRAGSSTGTRYRASIQTRVCPPIAEEEANRSSTGSTGAAINAPQNKV